MLPIECREARAKLVGLADELAQQFLDELAASIKKGVIKTTPFAYLRGLVKCARVGTYAPEGALTIARQRQCKAAVDLALTRVVPLVPLIRLSRSTQTARWSRDCSTSDSARVGQTTQRISDVADLYGGRSCVRMYEKRRYPQGNRNARFRANLLDRIGHNKTLRVLVKVNRLVPWAPIEQKVTTCRISTLNRGSTIFYSDGVFGSDGLVGIRWTREKITNR